MARHSPCGACKSLHRKCTDCIFAPYFPSDDLQKFEVVHKLFGASNVSKLLQALEVHQRADAVSSLVYEAKARLRDPVNGCVGDIQLLQSQVAQLEAARGLDFMSQAQITCIQNRKDVKGGKGKEAFQTPSGVAAGEAAESSGAAAKRKWPKIDLNKPPSGVAAGGAAESSGAAAKRKWPKIDLNKPPSGEDEDINKP